MVAGESREVVEVFDAGMDAAQRYPRALGRQPLRTVRDVQEEQARVYKAVTAGKVSPRVGNALTYQLRELVKTMEVATIEGQLEALLRERQKQISNK